jgi:hypothetical protein
VSAVTPAMAVEPIGLRKPAQRPVAACRTVEVGMAALRAAGRGGRVRGRALAEPEARNSSRGAVGGGGRGEHRELTDAD